MSLVLIGKDLVLEAKQRTIVGSRYIINSPYYIEFLGLVLAS